MKIWRNNIMIHIKFKMDDGDIGSYDFPLPLETIKELFPNKVIILLENNSFPWLKALSHQSLNAFELNAFTRIYLDLDSFEKKKINAIASVKKKLTINELIHHIKYQHYYALIDTFDDYNIHENLLRELLSQYYPDNSYIETNGRSEPKWIHDGNIVKKTLHHTLTDYGWLFTLNPELPSLSSNEHLFYSKWQKDPTILLTITNPQNNNFITLPLSLTETVVEESINRLDVENFKTLEVSVQNLTLDDNIFNTIKPLILNLDVIKINELVDKLNNLDTYEITCLNTVMDQASLDDIGKVEMVIDYLDDFRIIESTQHTTKDYASLKLDDLLRHDIENYKKLIASFLDYDAVALKMIEDNTVIKTKSGFLEVPISLSHLFKNHRLKDEKI